MSYILVMKKAQGVEYLLRNVADIILCECALLRLLARDYVLVELAVLKELGDYVAEAIVFEELVDAHDVWVADVLQDR